MVMAMQLSSYLVCRCGDDEYDVMVMVVSAGRLQGLLLTPLGPCYAGHGDHGLMTTAEC